MREKLKSTWKLEDGFNLMDITHGYILVNFYMDKDRDKDISGGLWMIFDPYLIVRPWTLDFLAMNMKVDKTLVWVHFPSLGMVFYEENVLLALESTIGRPIIDLNTLNMARGRFAQVCIEIDLDVPVKLHCFGDGGTTEGGWCGCDLARHGFHRVNQGINPYEPYVTIIA
ncbi:hypothetical protein D0Y65_038507 [Glycine soja]|uniref:DUF4283 domain-containing protein n=2 Tax=Glycine subgen. Soja TaxID=1462606 RepID=A0A0R0GPW6_SOYBN|nr:hypothetical protein D0Y65_038507 [Glycine soja]